MACILQEAGIVGRSVAAPDRFGQHGMAMSQHKIVVFVPVTHANALREAIGRAGGGQLGNYSYCSFSVRGVGRFRPEPGAHPAIGEVGKIEEVDEERIELVCDSARVEEVIAAIVKAHPYEEPALDVWPLESWK
jgi:hypothetical protein